VLGVICDGGSPNLDPAVLEGSEEACSEGTTAQTITTLSLTVDDGTSPNMHPQLPDVFATVEGMAWEAELEMPPVEACASAGSSPNMLAFSRADFGSLELLIRPDGVVREEYLTEVGIPPRDAILKEELLFSHFTTSGELERQFTVIDDERTEETLEWSELPGPDAIPAQGLYVRFFFVVRDQRGGIDWATRGLCLTP